MGPAEAELETERLTKKYEVAFLRRVIETHMDGANWLSIADPSTYDESIWQVIRNETFLVPYTSQITACFVCAYNWMFGSTKLHVTTNMNAMREMCKPEYLEIFDTLVLEYKMSRL